MGEGFQTHLGLSGTDRTFLWLAANFLKAETGSRLYLTRRPVFSRSTGIVAVNGFKEALQLMFQTGRKTLIVLNRNDLTADGLSKADRMGIRLIVWDHNGPTPEAARHLNRAVPVRRVICVSGDQADESRHRPVFRKIEVIPNPVDTGFWKPGRPNPGRHEVVFLGAITESKGFHHLAQAWPVVRSMVPDARLTVCGDAQLYDRRNRRGRLGVAAEDFEQKWIHPHLGRSRREAANMGVTFAGTVSPRRLKKILGRAAVGVVNPNVTTSGETFCISAAEMQACGLPVVGGRAGGLHHTVQDGISGQLLAKPGDLALTLANLLADPRRRMAMRGPARRHIRKFAPAPIFGQWIRLVRAVESGAPARPPAFLFRSRGMFTKNERRRLIKRLFQILGLSWLGDRLG